MAVKVNTTRKAVEISWDPTGGDQPEVRPPEFPEHPMDPPSTGDPDAHPEHPIYLPPYIDNSLPEPQPHPEHPIAPGGPSVEHPIAGGEEEEGDTGNLPPAAQPITLDETIAVQVFAQGQDGDWSNTDVKINDGLAVLSYPKDFKGESYVEVRSLDGQVVDSGTITVE